MHRPANPSAEYILVFDHPVWAKKEVLVPRDTVVTVRDRANSEAALGAILGASHDLEFTVKATGETHTTNYGYMFALNTPKNREALRRYREAREASCAADKAMRAAFEEVEIVSGPFERARLRLLGLCSGDPLEKTKPPGVFRKGREFWNRLE